MRGRTWSRPQGPVADEHNLVGLEDGSLYCVYRTIDGYLAAACSRDCGRSWSPPGYAEYTPGGRGIKHPRAAGFVRKLLGGRYILWYHNNGTRWYNNEATFRNRNVAWLSGGREHDGFLHWSVPEVVVYNDCIRARCETRNRRPPGKQVPDRQGDVRHLGKHRRTGSGL